MLQNILAIIVFSVLVFGGCVGSIVRHYTSKEIKSSREEHAKEIINKLDNKYEEKTIRPAVKPVGFMIRKEEQAHGNV